MSYNIILSHSICWQSIKKRVNEALAESKKENKNAIQSLSLLSS